MVRKTKVEHGIITKTRVTVGANEATDEATHALKAMLRKPTLNDYLNRIEQYCQAIIQAENLSSSVASDCHRAMDEIKDCRRFVSDGDIENSTIAALNVGLIYGDITANLLEHPLRVGDRRITLNRKWGKESGETRKHESAPIWEEEDRLRDDLKSKNPHLSLRELAKRVSGQLGGTSAEGLRSRWRTQQND